MILETTLTTSLNSATDNKLSNKVIHSGVKRLQQNLWQNDLYLKMANRQLNFSSMYNICLKWL